MIKAVFFDIDGTLIPVGGNRMPQDTKDALMQLKKKGIKIFLASGRGVKELGIITDDVKFDGYITLNGQICLDENFQFFYGNPIPSEDMNVLKYLFEEKKIAAIIVEKDDCYINYIDEEVLALQKDIGVAAPRIGSYEGEPVYQMMVYADLQTAEELFEKLPNCKWSRWHSKGIDVFSKAGGKVTGIKKTLEYFGIRKEETMAFGDGDNDVDMLKFVNIGVAMGNAEKATKAAADYITAAQEAQGISNALKFFGLI